MFSRDRETDKTEASEHLLGRDHSSEDGSDSDYCDRCRLASAELTTLRRRMRILITSFTTLFTVAILTAVISAVTHAAKSHNHPPHSSPVEGPDGAHWHALGTDPSGFVPEQVGYPLRPMIHNASSPWFIPGDVFSSPDVTESTVHRLKMLHNTSSVIVPEDSGHANWMRPDGHRGKLPVYVSPYAHGHAQYVVRGLYQMECLVALAEEVGWLYAHRDGMHDHGEDECGDGGKHGKRLEADGYGSEGTKGGYGSETSGKDGKKEGKKKQMEHEHDKEKDMKPNSPWGPERAAHCLNTLRDAVMCTADATPVSWVMGYAQGQVTDDQVVMCRDWEGLVAWAQEEERRGERLWVGEERL